MCDVESQSNSDFNRLLSEACSKGQYLDQTKGCQNCPENQWSDGGSVASCNNCPANKGVAEGAGTSQDSCTWSKFIQYS